MTDYLAEMRDVFKAGMAEPLGSETERLAYEAVRTGALASSATDIRRLADGIERIAESLSGVLCACGETVTTDHTHPALPQGTEHVTGETTGIGAPAPSPAEPSPCVRCATCGDCHQRGHNHDDEPSLVALDHAEADVIAAATEWVRAKRAYLADASDAHAITWGGCGMRLEDAVDRIELAR